MTFGPGCLRQFLRNQFNHKGDVYKTIYSVHACAHAGLGGCFSRLELKGGQVPCACSCCFVFTLDPCKVFSKGSARFLDREDSVPVFLFLNENIEKLLLEEFYILELNEAPNSSLVQLQLNEETAFQG